MGPVIRHLGKLLHSSGLCFSLVVLIFLPMAEAPPAEDSALEVVSKSIEAMGGREAIESVQSLGVRAECMAPEGPFSTEIFSYLPDRVLFRQKSDRGSVELGLVGEVGWSRDGETGEIKPLPEAMKRFLLGHEFHLLALGLETRYSDHRLAEVPPVLNRRAPKPCIWIEMVDSWDSPVSACIARKGHLPVTMVFRAPDELGGDKIWVDFEDWKPIEGVMYFHAFTLFQGNEEFRYDYRSIQPNDVDPALYVIPEDIPPEAKKPGD